jgi:hypothetical protein
MGDSETLTAEAGCSSGDDYRSSKERSVFRTRRIHFDKMPSVNIAMMDGWTIQYPGRRRSAPRLINSFIIEISLRCESSAVHSRCRSESEQLWRHCVSNAVSNAKTFVHSTTNFSGQKVLRFVVLWTSESGGDQEILA